MAMRALLCACALVLVAAAKDVEEPAARPLTKAELAHKRHFFSIGEGFEGTASDWTEYAVWLVGVCGVLAYMANPNMRRNLHAVEDDEPTASRADGDDGASSGREKAD